MTKKEIEEKFKKLTKDIEFKKMYVDINELMEKAKIPPTKKEINKWIRQVADPQNEEEKQQRETSIYFLGSYKVESSIDVLIDIFPDEKSSVLRKVIVQSLGTIAKQPKKVIPFLEKVMWNDKSSKVRCAVPVSLANFGLRVKQILFKVVKEGQDVIVEKAIFALNLLARNYESSREEIANFVRNYTLKVKDPNKKYSIAITLLRFKPFEEIALLTINELIEQKTISKKQISEFRSFYDLIKRPMKLHFNNRQLTKEQIARKALQIGESERVEFKSSLCKGKLEKNAVRKSEFEIVKTIAGFMNKNGGVILIGVSDDKKIIGIDDDYRVFFNGEANHDKYQQRLRNLIDRYFEFKFSDLIRVVFPIIEEKEICLIYVKKSPEAVFITNIDKHKDFFVRILSSTQRIESDDIEEYISLHWENV
ncbi:MAG: hypothetical protein GPJ52_11245 [Candidatus Heimdallarchaeota archaeon]|nr:hypothetical protein [Candidatus Heimdallarchaeota archaeon]